MTEGQQALLAHLATGCTSVCRAWVVRRGDGLALGFTDHDLDLKFDGVLFRAASGMTARSLIQSSGLSVDNSAALGALSDASIAEEDILAGRFDGAAVECWRVNWRHVAERALLFRGTLGEIRRQGGLFEAELRGLAETLNQPRGRVYHRLCSAALGDAACGFDLTATGYALEGEVVADALGGTLRVAVRQNPDPGWFEQGCLRILDGRAAGLQGEIKADRLLSDGMREIELWQMPAHGVMATDRVVLVAGCDKRAETCRVKFYNFNNFRGFPHVPGEDWMTSFPASSGANDGGSLRG